MDGEGWRLQPRAEEDVVEHATAAVAVRFFEAVVRAAHGLVEMPGKGRARESANPRLHGMRSWGVPEFPNHYLFYLPREHVIVVRVLHGMRDLEGQCKLK